MGFGLQVAHLHMVRPRAVAQQQVNAVGAVCPQDPLRVQARVPGFVLAGLLHVDELARDAGAQFVVGQQPVGGVAVVPRVGELDPFRAPGIEARRTGHTNWCAMQGGEHRIGTPSRIDDHAARQVVDPDRIAAQTQAQFDRLHGLVVRQSARRSQAGQGRHADRCIDGVGFGRRVEDHMVAAVGAAVDVQIAGDRSDRPVLAHSHRVFGDQAGLGAGPAAQRDRRRPRQRFERDHVIVVAADDVDRTGDGVEHPQVVAGTRVVEGQGERLDLRIPEPVIDLRARHVAITRHLARHQQVGRKQLQR
jgi:hypothetical protein